MGIGDIDIVGNGILRRLFVVIRLYVLLVMIAYLS